MTNVFINHNERALKLVEKFANEIYTSLNADPSKTKYNHIVTVPAKQRNESNGIRQTSDLTYATMAEKSTTTTLELRQATQTTVLSLKPQRLKKY